jgi:hypothetical protein
MSGTSSSSDVRAKVLASIYEYQVEDPLAMGVNIQSIINKTKADESEVIGAVRYLQGKGFLAVQWFVGGQFFAKLTPRGIDELQRSAGGVVRQSEIDARNKVLLVLHALFAKDSSSYVDRNGLAEAAGLGQNLLLSAVTYLEGKALIQVDWFIGGNFIAKITASGIDSVERVEKEKRAPEPSKPPKGIGRPQINVSPIFPSVTIEPDDKLVFVLMPFDSEFDPIYRDHIKPTVEGLGLRSVRADEIFSNRQIMEDIWEHILKARLIISDLTGRNPNVFYETGICHTVGKDVILLSQSMRDVPFDVRYIRVVTYGSDAPGLSELDSKLLETMKFILSRR